MPSYAVLGSTGNVGQNILKVLLQSPTNEIHAFCRSKQKLLKLVPEVADNKQVRVFEGNLDDTQLLVDGFKDTRAIFFAVAPPGNQPGCTVVQDAARDVIAALERMRDLQLRVPKLLLVSSASTEHRLMSASPQFLLDTLYRAFSNTYDDLKAAEAFLRSKDDLVSVTFVKPGALCVDAQKGHVLDLNTAKSPLSYLDLAAGMLEVADDESGRFDMKSVAVNASAKDVAFPWEAPAKLFWGLVFHFMPWLYHYLG